MLTSLILLELISIQSGRYMCNLILLRMTLYLSTPFIVDIVFSPVCVSGIFDNYQMIIVTWTHILIFCATCLFLSQYYVFYYCKSIMEFYENLFVLFTLAVAIWYLILTFGIWGVFVFFYSFEGCHGILLEIAINP